MRALCPCNARPATTEGSIATGLTEPQPSGNAGVPALLLSPGGVLPNGTGSKRNDDSRGTLSPRHTIPEDSLRVSKADNVGGL